MRHGGTRRSEQLKELLGDVNSVTLNPYLRTKPSLIIALRHPLTFAYSLIFSLYLLFTSGLSFLGLLQYAICSVNLLKVIKRHEFDIVLYETAPGISIPFMRYLSLHNINYIAIPHNIEYLVPGQVMKIFRTNYHVYKTEIQGYRAASKVLTIGDFDTSILRCSGVNAYTLEYRPIRSDRARFELIRQRRAANTKFEGFLLLGTVENTPTLNGVRTLLDTLRSHRPDLCLTVAGYGTEKLKSYESASISVLGSVTESQVESLLCHTRAMLINQPQTTGFLTKIVEMNMCGVPQIVISDYFQVTGLERFGINKVSLESLNQLHIPTRFELLPDLATDNPLKMILDGSRP